MLAARNHVSIILFFSSLDFNVNSSVVSQTADLTSHFAAPISTYAKNMSTTETLTWTKPVVSAEEGHWADLVTLDLSKFDQPGGKQELAADFIRAIEEVGQSIRCSQLSLKHPLILWSHTRILLRRELRSY